MTEAKKTLEDLKDRKINEDALDDVSGGADIIDNLNIIQKSSLLKNKVEDNVVKLKKTIVK